MNETLFDIDRFDVAQNFDSDSWETPTEIARKMAALVKPSDRVTEPAAGRGAIVREIKDCARLRAIELKPNRFLEGREQNRHAVWMNGDFLKIPALPVWTLVLANPPFSLAIEFIEHSLKWLDPNDPDSRLLYLLPGDYFASQARNDRFEALNCCISHRYRIRGRVGYIKDGVQQDQRQVYDCVYEIRLGKDRASETVL